MVQITIQSIYGDYRKSLTCLTIPTITDLIPVETFPRESIKIPNNIKLADPEFHIPRSIDLLIGSGATLSLFSIGQINLSHEGHDLYLQKTRLGWVISGSTSSQIPLNATKCYLTNLERLITKFWEIEELDKHKSKSEEEKQCETHFLENVSRDINGHYIVRLPFRKLTNHLDSRVIALKRLFSLERKLNANENLKLEYNRVIEDYIRLNYMSLINDSEINEGYYMPHHAVVKESSNTTKVRIVFDASAKSNNGISLNDVLMIGPQIQSNLFIHLVRFRTYNYVLTADIEKMYCQVLLHEKDRRYQKILWRVNGKIETFQLNTLTFGVSSSPFLAIRVMQKLAEDESYTFPRASEIIKTHFYVDDLLTGAETIEEAIIIRDEIIKVLSKGGFNIRQWASNEQQILNDLPTGSLHANFAPNMNHSLKTLGITWNAHDDKLYYTAHPINIADRVTKRNILSEIAKIFDPLGLLGPVVFYAKRLMQEVWRCNLQWDESVPQTIYTDWIQFIRQLESLDRISFDRKLFVNNYCDVQLHGFCDASKAGYKACLYARSRNENGITISKLICAKSRVAPLKNITIPRLELCGAILLARLFNETHNTLNIIINKVVFWCDSTIVLHWIKASPHLLKTYVSNRIAEIQKLTDSNAWRHVGSEDNPADAISRGQLPHAFLQNRIWLEGPLWLNNDEREWPNLVMQSIELPEVKRNTCLLTSLHDFEILGKYSSYSKLIRIIAYCLRWRLNNKHTGLLCTAEINDAEIRLLKIIQAISFSNEIEKINAHEILSHKLRIANLSPFIDENGLIRVGGRLRKSQLTFSQKHPILLPNRHFITDCIIRETHEMYYHAGIQTTSYIIRQRFWILDGRNQVRKIIRMCMRCFRFTANSIEYKMGNFPPNRVREAIPFTNTGIDFCGPFYIKERKYRNRTKIKTYVCIFVCMSIKAIHLELVSDLSSEGFITALKRFISRRGLPEHIYSDNGTNFIGANNELKKMFSLFNSDQHKILINNFSNKHRISWHFIPPVAPHFGGLWESSVKLFKHHFKRVVGDSLFTFEELNTFIIEVEGILNSRPITTLSSDPNDIMALTPAHYFIGKPLTALPEGNLLSVPVNQLSVWQHITKVRQDFWSRWYLEYLNELQKRNKWIIDGPNLKIGTIVLIKNKGLPCTQWILGKIIALHQGEDKIARIATVKTANGKFKRSTRLLCPLPVEE